MVDQVLRTLFANSSYHNTPNCSCQATNPGEVQIVQSETTSGIEVFSTDGLMKNIVMLYKHSKPLSGSVVR
jgi:hypothetical protein